MKIQSAPDGYAQEKGNFLNVPSKYKIWVDEKAEKKDNTGNRIGNASQCLRRQADLEPRILIQKS